METATEPSTAAREFLTFTLGAEEYGIDILKVQEIRGYDTVTRIANTPAYIRGVINLRGHIVPIIDLRVRFALGEAKYDAFTVVIILNIGKRIVGVVVDSVSDVMTLRADQIRQAPEFSSTLGTEYLLGLGTLEDRMIILVDIACLLESPDMGLTEPEAVAEAL